MTFSIINPRSVRDISSMLLDERGCLRVVDAEVLAQTTREERALFGVRHACYVLPTKELIEHLLRLIDGRKAIEIGAGNGVIARALGIPATDNHQQTWPEVKAHYEMLKQPVICYGDNVEKLSAIEAVEKYKPEVVVAAWVTHQYEPQRHWAGGNENGVDESALLARCREYIFIGNEVVHKNKLIWEQPHTKNFHDFLFSRAANGSRDFLATWKGSASSR